MIAPNNEAATIDALVKAHKDISNAYQNMIEAAYFGVGDKWVDTYLCSQTIAMSNIRDRTAERIAYLRAKQLEGEQPSK